MAEASKRKNIGFLANDLDDEYCKSLCNGAARAAEELDCNLFVFSGRFYESTVASKRIGPYAYQYNTCFAYANADTLDALVVSVGTLNVENTPEAVKAFLDSIGNIPVVFIGQRIQGCGSVMFEQYDGMRSIVDHLINRHGCRRIAFVGGPPENPESDIRKQAYIDSLACHRIPYNEKLVTNGDFTMFYTEPIAKLLDNCGHDIDAICFANDLMAAAGYKLMRERGIEPGKDVLVTGYDNCVFTASLDPILTTVSADPTHLGFSAVVSAMEQANGKAAEDITINVMPLFLPSCGCSMRNAELTEEQLSLFPTGFEAMIDCYFDALSEQMRLGTLAEKLHTHFRKMASYVAGNLEAFGESGPVRSFSSIMWSDTFDSLTARIFFRIIDAVQRILLYRNESREQQKRIMSLCGAYRRIVSEILMTNVYALSREARGEIYLLNNLPMYESCDVDSQLELIADHLSRLNIYSSYVYLSEQPAVANDQESYKPFDSLSLRAYTRGKESHVIVGYRELISCRDLFDNIYVPDRRRTMVLSSLFYRNEHFGLFVCELPASQMYYIQMLTMQICLIIKNVSLINQLNAQNALLSSMASEDTLTGLLNKRGFHKEANDVLHAPENRGKPVLIGFIDMDNLKLTNDNYGHDEGNAALEIIANVLRNCFGEDACIARTGGDEFNVLKLLGPNETPGEYRLKLKIQLQKAVEKSDKQYGISFSVGFAVAVCEYSARLDNYITMADSDMYMDKRHKPKNI